MSNNDEQMQFKYPRRRVIRGLIQRFTRVAFAVLADFRVIGRENVPKTGPLLVVGNHFSFLDPVALIAVAPWPVEFVGGFRVPNAPPAVGWLRKLWGYYPVYRGTGSQIAFRAAQAVLGQKGVLAIFPEGSSAYAMLRRPRPGAAFMAARSHARMLPIGFDGLTEMFPAVRRGRRASVKVRIGKPFGPFTAPGRGRERRGKIDAISEEIMQRIAELLPADRRGHYSDDLAIRAAAHVVDAYPWDEEPEG
ncbi:MAG: lysophospholipid acyltransferase family protein [Anaerolineae bacterium]